MTEYAPTTLRSPTSDQARERVTEAIQVAQDNAQAASQRARGRLRDQLDQRATQAGERLAGTAAEVRSVAEELRRQGKDTPARLAEQLARPDRPRGRLPQGRQRRADPARRRGPRPRQPVGGGGRGLMLGFAASRFPQASSRRRYQAAQPPPRVG